MIDNTYNYEVNFDQQESFVFVEETGAFTYKNVKVNNGMGQYVDPFSTRNLLITNGTATTYDAEQGVDVDMIVLVDKADEDKKTVLPANIQVGHTYEYDLIFTGVGEVGSTPGIIYHSISGEFTYDRVKDLSTLQPITANNISIEDDSASIINIDPTIEVNYIKFFNGATEIPVADLVIGQSYSYEVSFVSSDSTVYKVETGSVRIGGPVMSKGTGTEYNVPFSISNILVAREDVGDYDLVYRIIDINPNNNVRSVVFYDDNGQIIDVASLSVEGLYSYKVYFYNDDGYNWQTAKGEFMLKRIRNEAGTAVFNAHSNLRFKNGEAYLIDVTEGLEVRSSEIYDKNTKEQITDLTTLEDGHFYYYRIFVKSKEGRIWQEEMGDFSFNNDFIGV